MEDPTECYFMDEIIMRDDLYPTTEDKITGCIDCIMIPLEFYDEAVNTLREIIENRQQYMKVWFNGRKFVPVPKKV